MFDFDFDFDFEWEWEWEWEWESVKESKIEGTLEKFVRLISFLFSSLRFSAIESTLFSFFLLVEEKCSEERKDHIFFLIGEGKILWREISSKTKETICQKLSLRLFFVCLRSISITSFFSFTQIYKTWSHRNETSTKIIINNSSSNINQ